MTTQTKVETKDYLIALLLALLILVSRLTLAMPHDVYFSSDSGNYALGMEKYSIKEDMPHLPGYYLHIQAAKIVNIFTENKQQSLILLSVLYSSIAGFFFFLLFRKFVSRKDSIILFLLLMTNPYIWFFGCLPEIYSFDLLFGILLVYFSFGNKIYFLPVLLSLGLGFRQTSGMLLFPLYLYLWFIAYKEKRINFKYFLSSHILGTICLLLWFLPMAYASGGVAAYFELYKSKQNQFPKFTTGKNLVEFFSYSIWAMTSLFLAILPSIIKTNREVLKQYLLGNKKNIIIALVWLVPPVLFFMFMHIAKGYLLLCLPALLLAFYPLLLKKPKSIYWVCILIILQSLVFIFYPYKPADDQINFTSNSRTISNTQVWLNRMNSSYAVTYPQIKHYDDLYNDLSLVIKAISIDSRGALPVIFVDPSVLVKVRTLPLIYTDLKFAKFNFDDSITVSMFYSVKEDLMPNPEPLLIGSYIIGNKTFVDLYIPDLIEKMHQYKYLAVYRIKHDKIGDYLSKLNKLFKRN